MTEDDTRPDLPRRMRLRYAGRCRGCDIELPRGTQAVYDPGTRTVMCLGCESADRAAVAAGVAATTAAQELAEAAAEEVVTSPTEVDPGVAGSSARREHERRAAAREQRIRGRHPRLGGLIIALSDEPQTTQAWATGATGEERLGRRLDATAGPLVRLLHDRAIPGSRANLDHLVVCPTGVVVVDAKRYRGRPQRTVEGGLFSPRREKLMVGRRDCTRLVDAGLSQAALVRGALAEDAVPVRSVLCFIDADWPLVGGNFVIRDVTVTWPRRLASAITRPGALGEREIAEIHGRLAAAFPPA